MYYFVQYIFCRILVIILRDFEAESFKSGQGWGRVPKEKEKTTYMPQVTDTNVIMLYQVHLTMSSQFYWKRKPEYPKKKRKPPTCHKSLTQIPGAMIVR
jgi:hypothetical protein